jgi:hypothetical protein
MSIEPDKKTQSLDADLADLIPRRPSGKARGEHTALQQAFP